ncbi:MAG: UMP kinase [bacterium]
MSSPLPASRRYQRVLLKLSGEVFDDPGFLKSVVDQLAALRRRKIRVAVVVGGGNILRGRDTADMDRATADKAGMLATVINGIRLAEALRRRRLAAVHLTARSIAGFVPGYDITTARRAFEDGILVLSGGTGNPFFSTDSAAALRAVELSCDALLKATNVAGVYSADPKQDPDARFLPRLGYRQALAEGLKVMDLTAFALCMEHRVPVLVFDLRRPGAIIGIIDGKKIGSCVC